MIILLMSQSQIDPDPKDPYVTTFSTAPNYRSYADLPMRKGVPQWNKSVAVLRHSPIHYSIPKDARFKESRQNGYNPSKMPVPSSLSHRATTFGYGNKSPVPEIFSSNKNQATKGVPFYEVDDMKIRRNKSETIRKGKTIGMPWSAFQDARTPHRATVHSAQQVKSNPGPNKYDVAGMAGANASKSSIHLRLRMFSDLNAYRTRHQPGPLNYRLNEKHTSRSPQKTNFGLGKKLDFTLNPEKANVPAPIYNISGFCDKFHNLKGKNLGRSWK